MSQIDLLAGYSADRVRINARVYQELLRKPSQSADIAMSQEDVRKHLSGFLDLQLDRLCDWVEGPVDLLALVTRSLLELLFWTEYVLEAKQNAQRFVEEQRIELAELVSKAISAFEVEAKGLFDESPEGLAALLEVKGKRVDSSRRGDWTPTRSSSNPSISTLRPGS